MNKRFNSIIYIWLVLLLCLALPILLNHLCQFFQYGCDPELVDTFCYLALILGGVGYVAGIVLLWLRKRLGLWMMFLLLPLAYAIAVATLALQGIDPVDDHLMMFRFYVGIPLLLDAVTLGLLLLRRDGVSGWMILQSEHKKEVI